MKCVVFSKLQVLQWRQLCCPGLSKSSAFFFSLKYIQIWILANKCFPRRISSSWKCPHHIWPLVLDHIGVTTFRASTTWCRLNWMQGLWVGFLQTNFIVSDFKNSEGEKGVAFMKSEIGTPKLFHIWIQWSAPVQHTVARATQMCWRGFSQSAILQIVTQPFLRTS